MDGTRPGEEPVAGSPQAVPQGKKVARVNCASCHGNTGKGNSPAAMALQEVAPFPVGAHGFPRTAPWTGHRLDATSPTSLQPEHFGQCADPILIDSRQELQEEAAGGERVA